MKRNNKKSIEGFSIIELLVVLTIMSVMAAVTGYYLMNHQKLYKPDNQALQIIDVLQEARQRALTKRETMRVEIDLTDNMVRLIDENTPATEADDRQLKQMSLMPATDVNIEQRPTEILNAPPETLPVPAADFRPSIYPSSATHRVCTLRFQSNGQVVNAGNSPTGTNAAPSGATLYVWSPNEANANESDVARAITIVGTTGSIKMWEYHRESTQTNKWFDSRRAGGYGGQANATPVATP